MALTWKQPNLVVVAVASVLLSFVAILVCFICLQTIERIFISSCMMWIHGLQAQTKSSSERFLRLLSCYRHYVVTTWILQHVYLFDRFFTCDVARFMQWLHNVCSNLKVLRIFLSCFWFMPAYHWFISHRNFKGFFLWSTGKWYDIVVKLCLRQS